MVVLEGFCLTDEEGIEGTTPMNSKSIRWMNRIPNSSKRTDAGIQEDTVFVSYAREDAGTVEALGTILAGTGVRIWVDTANIDYATKWRAEIEFAISRATIFVALITPPSIGSIACRLELEHAILKGKRVLPLVSGAISEEQVPADARSFQWFRSGEAIINPEEAAKAILKSLHTDADWLHRHTAITARASQWLSSGRNKSFHLRGEELKQAKKMLSAPPNRIPRLATDATALVEISARSQRNTNYALLSISAIILSVLLSIAIVAALSRYQADMQERYALRGRVAQLASIGDTAAVADLASAKAEAVFADPLTSLQVRFSAADNLGEMREINPDFTYIAVRGNFALLKSDGYFPTKLLDIENWEVSDPWIVDGVSGMDLSFNGKRLVLWGEHRLVVADSGTKNIEMDVQLKEPIDYVSLGSTKRAAALQFKDRLDFVAFDPQGKSFRTIFSAPGTTLIKRLRDDLILVRFPPQEQGDEGYAYQVWGLTPDQQSPMKRLCVASISGRLTNAMFNDAGVLALVVDGAAYGFQMPITRSPQMNPGCPESARFQDLGRIVLSPDQSVTLSPDSTRLAAIGAYGVSQMHRFGENLSPSYWEINQAPGIPGSESLADIREGTTGQGTAAFSRNGEHLFVPGEFNSILSPSSGYPIADFVGGGDTETGTGDDILVTEDTGRYVIGAHFQTPSRTSLRRYSIPESLQAFSISALAAILAPRDAGLLVLQPNGELRIEGNGKSLSISTLPDFPTDVAAAALSKNGTFAAAVNASVNASEAEVSLWRIRDARKLWTVNIEKPDRLNSFSPLEFSPMGDALLVSGSDNATLLDIKDGNTRCSVPRNDVGYEGMASFFRDKYLIATAMDATNGTGWENRVFSVYNYRTCEATSLPYERISSWSADELDTRGYGLGLRLDSAGLGWLVDRTFGSKFLIRNVLDGRRVGMLSSHEGRVLNVLPLSDFGLLVSTDDGGRVNVWDLETLRLIKTLLMPACPASAVDLSPSGRYLLAGCPGRVYRAWDISVRRVQQATLREKILNGFRSILTPRKQVAGEDKLVQPNPELLTPSPPSP